MAKIRSMSTVKFNCSDLNSLMKMPREFSYATDEELEFMKEYESRCMSDEIRIPKKDINRYEKIRNKIEMLANNELDTLSETTKSLLRKYYVKLKYGKTTPAPKKEVPILYTAHGTESEDRCIELIKRVTGMCIYKHEDLISNKLLKGKIDGYLGLSLKRSKVIVEIKSAISYESLLNSLEKDDEDDSSFWQAQGYMHITGAERVETYHCLVSYSERLIESEYKKYAYYAKSQLSPESFYLGLETIRRNMTFDDIPENRRVVKKVVYRDEESIQLINKRVPLFRKYLTILDKKASGLNL